MNIKKKYNKEVYKNFALITQIGISMMTPIFLMLMTGLYLEKKTGWFLTVPCMILGFLAGFRNVYILTVKAAKSRRNKEMEEEKRLVDEAIEKWNKVK